MNFKNCFIIIILNGLRLILFESKLFPDGPKYIPLEIFQLRNQNE